MLNKKTKIVCTIGPSSWDSNVMKGMIEAGMNCARVNGAFADPAELDKVRQLVRDVSQDVSLMVDVKGPEVRMNKFGDPKPIKPGDKIIIGNTENDEIYPSNYKNLYTFIKPGQRVVIGDGDVELKVIEIKGDQMICEVVYGELLKPGKALNLPGAEYTSEVLTEKDQVNLKHAIETGWDSVSASFIKDAKSAQYVKEFIGESDMKLIAKIEDQTGIDNIDEILEVVDGIMVARGGLGVEMGLEKVPMAEKILIEKATAAGKPVITATQMLESMITNPRPTRAEVNDVAMAILMGTDAVMLSAESSAGQYPIEAVKEMSKIAREVEPFVTPRIHPNRANGYLMTDAIAKAASQLAIELEGEIDVVISVSRTGRLARLIGRSSIKQPIYAFTGSDFFTKSLSISKGIYKAFTLDKSLTDRDDAVKEILLNAKALGIVKDGQWVLLVSKTPTTDVNYYPNVLEVVEVK